MALFCCFLWLSSIQSFMYHSFFISVSIDGQLGCFSVLAIGDSGAVNIGVRVSFWIIVFFSPDICPGVGLLDHMVILSLVFWGTFILFSIVTASTYIPTNKVGGFPFLYTLFSICKVFNDGHSDWCEVLLHCSFYLHLSDN